MDNELTNGELLMLLKLRCNNLISYLEENGFEIERSSKEPIKLPQGVDELIDRVMDTFHFIKTKRINTC